MLLTLTVGSGVLFSEGPVRQGLPARPQDRLRDHLVAALRQPAGRPPCGAGGPQGPVLTLAGFVALMLAYVGSRFVAEVLLGRGACQAAPTPRRTVENVPLSVQSLILVTLLALSGFFSMAETSMMAANRFTACARPPAWAPAGAGWP